ncbi:MAG: DUF305 domain-containing protein [Hydrococcus sp. Prado102]|jgi:uncharacterized protein (DUF305 family)|nr:DUF305 domain-containing protein [Hydrococcus sp. Prado102]
MKNKYLSYSFVGLMTSSILVGLLTIDPIKAQTQISEQDSHHPKQSQTPNPTGRGMMNQQQIDRHFIEMMIPHHEEAVKMADMALSRTKRPEIKQLAQAIKTDQNREIEQMRGWYQAWYGTQVPAVSMADMGMMGMGQGTGMSMHRDMRGMQADLEALKNTSDFDREFIAQMIPHHQMAVMMARMVRDSTTRPEIRTLAESIIKTQTSEISQMRQWYQAWYE